MRRASLLLATLLALPVSAPAAEATDTQLARGKAAYARVCIACHGASLEGGQFGPALKGPAFQALWRGRTPLEFAERVRTTMPPRGLGSVSGQAYADIEAYIRQANNLPVSGEGARGPAVAEAAMGAAVPVGAAAPANQRGEGGEPLFGAWPARRHRPALYRRARGARCPARRADARHRRDAAQPARKGLADLAPQLRRARPQPAAADRPQQCRHFAHRVELVAAR